jgi:hypothetical protein
MFQAIGKSWFFLAERAGALTLPPMAGRSIELPITSLTDLSQPLTESWNIVKVGLGRDNSNSRVEEHAGCTCLRVAYPKGSVTPSTCGPGHPLGGIGFYASPVAMFPCTEAVLEYSVYFDASFNPCKGGKPIHEPARRAEPQWGQRRAQNARGRLVPRDVAQGPGGRSVRVPPRGPEPRVREDPRFHVQQEIRRLAVARRTRIREESVEHRCACTYDSTPWAAPTD